MSKITRNNWFWRSFQHVDNFKQTTHMLDSFDALNSNLSAMHRTQGLLDIIFLVSNFFRGKLSVLGLFMCINATCELYNFDQKTVPGGENQRRTEEKLSEIYHSFRYSSRNSKFDRIDFGTEKTAQKWRISSCLSEGGSLKSKSSVKTHCEWLIRKET